MEKLIEYLKLSQEELKAKLYQELKTKDMNPIFEDGFIYAKGNIPILLVAHMDTVSEEPPKDIIYLKDYDVLYNPNGILGGDDRCGIYAIMKILDKYKPHVLFTEDEEIGCVGAKKTIKKLPAPKVKYIVEIDRRGENDCVFYECGNKDFYKYIESFGFKKNNGSYSDISVLGSSWNIASVNLSSGYYNEHSPREFIVFNQLQKTINRLENMINSLSKSPYFDYQNIKHNNSNFLNNPFFINLLKQMKLKDNDLREGRENTKKI